MTTSGIDAFYNERDDTVILAIGASNYTLYASQAWDLLDRLQSELRLAGMVRDEKGD